MISVGLTAIYGLLSMERSKAPGSASICTAILSLIALMVILPVRVPVSEATMLFAWALAAFVTSAAQWWVIRRLLRERRAMLALADRLAVV